MAADPLAQASGASLTSGLRQRAEIFRRGEVAIPAMRKAGARHVHTPFGPAPISTRRRDMVYSPLEGSTQNSPGIPFITPTVSESTLQKSRRRRNHCRYYIGMTCAWNRTFVRTLGPIAMLRITEGNLVDVLVRLLCLEPSVVTVNLNLVER